MTAIEKVAHPIPHQDLSALMTEITNSLHNRLKWRAELEPAVVVAKVLEKVFSKGFINRCGDIFSHDIFFKCETIDEVGPIIRYITLIGGLHQVGEKAQTGLVAVWDFNILKLHVTFAGKCRMVKTGEKVIPEHVEDVVEMVCGEEPPPVVTETATAVVAEPPPANAESGEKKAEGTGDDLPF